MAKKLTIFGCRYVAYEIASTALVLGGLAAGLRIPGF